MKNRKILILDTSVLLYDKNAIHSFPGNDIVLPLEVLDELDHFKDKPGVLGENARFVNRFLDDLRKIGKLHEGIEIEDTGQTIRIETTKIDDHLPSYSLDFHENDNRIIACALMIQESSECDVSLITKDINLRVKCDALGLTSDDYWKDHVDSTKIESIGHLEIAVDEEIVDLFFEEGSLDLKKIQYKGEDLFENQFVIGKSNLGTSFLARHLNGKLHKINKNRLHKNAGVTPKNKEQSFALELLTDNSLQLVTISGVAGSGKTFLTLMAGLSALWNDRYNRLIITRNIEPVGRDMGFLPGNLDEKMAPWLSPIMDNFRHAFKDMTYFDMMKEKGEIEIAPLAYVRGRTFNDAYVIVDEAQNATIHELKTIITRIGKGSKIILLGDTDQIDTPYIDKKSSGLSIVIEKFLDSKIAGHIQLRSSQRSEIAAAASQIL